ncbi:MAG: TIGR03617 family F420-dependent LLM class oxidoreductase [Actinomycetota bacterium]|nr:TIGR03617 family F420-dependent LLM class oxidoreductase [Actinomycetota bacterium]
MTGSGSWAATADLARNVESAGFSGMLFTETSQTPFMQIAAAAMAAPELFFTTGIAVAFPRSPMVSAAIAYELASNTGGRFRLGLGSQVKAHITRRYGVDFEHPAARLRDYVLAVKACFRAFNREEKLAHEGEFYNLSLLPADWAPKAHDHPMKVDISAVGPHMMRVAGEVADGVHVHPLHSIPYIQNRLLPGLAEGAAMAGRDAAAIDLIIPVFACPGDTPEERAAHVARARQQIGFYGTTPNYAFQFDDLGFEGTTSKLRERMKVGDLAGMAELITDEMLDAYAVVGTWDEMGAKLVDRYQGTAARIVMYMGENQIRHDPDTAAKWGEIATAVRGAK